MVSRPYSLRAASLKMAPTVGMAGGTYIPRTEGGGGRGRSLWLPWSRSQVNLRSCPLPDLLQHMELSICPRLLCEWKVNTWQYQRGSLESGCSLSLHDHWEIGVWAHAMPVGTGAAGDSAGERLSSKATVKWGEDTAHKGDMCRNQGRGAGLYNQETGCTQGRWEKNWPDWA